MKQIKIADATLCREDSHFSFKEKIEIARQLENLNVDIIEFPEIANAKVDTLLIKTVSSFVKNSVISVACGIGSDSVDNAIASLSTAKMAQIRVEVPVSPVGMEYTCHKKPDKMLIHIENAIKTAKQVVNNIEFCAVDATRAEKEFLKKAIDAAVSAGATSVSVCDSAANMLPDDFAEFASTLAQNTSVPVGVKCDNTNGMAIASAILAVKSGVSFIKTAVDGNTVPLETFADMVKNCGNDYGFSANIKFTELHRIINQIRWVTGNSQAANTAIKTTDNTGIHLDKDDDIDTVSAVAAKLGYDLSEEDKAKVFEEFGRVATKKNVGYKELEAIIASVALQVPSTYTLVNYVINTGNIIPASAQITIQKGDEQIQGVCIGDGPIDAAFLAVEQIIGHHYELDDFQINSVTEGKEAMGSAIVKLRSNGKLYSGNGISTDILSASIRAYINAVNKIVYEEA
ncbi:MAG: alpha-isopropylmalate synthase regulatory domain-containing protein [Clostridia bacterium]|nr:alpha-isopropylmalate synthase regulatory domain-containing protein [Clostridia bacterium]